MGLVLRWRLLDECLTECNVTRSNRHKKIRIAGQRAPKSSAATPGRHTLREILSQPLTWTDTFARLHQEGTIARLAEQFTAEEPWLFVACGSSYYLSQLVSAIWSRNLGIRCSAVPASELLFAPEEFRTLGVTCNAGSRFASLCTHIFTLPWADEKSTVMTRSFTSMLLAFQKLGARLKREQTLAASLDSLPQTTAPWLDANADRIRKFASTRKFADFVFLGQGAHYWLAQEAALKVTEMSASYAQAYHTLEFRHGPRSIAGPETLITFLISDAAAEEEILLVRELKALGAANLAIVNRATPEIRDSSDLLIELNLDGLEFARFAVTAIPAQLLGAAVGLRKGLDPDAPRHLSRAVVLGETIHNRKKRSLKAKVARS